MRTKSLALFLMLFFALAESGLAEKIYILYDPSCMDQLEYQQLSPGSRSTYLSYHINIGIGEKMILETGMIGRNAQNYLPPSYLSCGAPEINQNLVDRINGNNDEVFILIPQQNSYLVQPVSLAGYYQKQGTLITYSSPKYQFRFDTQNATIGRNIAFDDPDATVYFQLWEVNQCQGIFMFEKLAPNSAYPVINFKLAPEVGIIEERLGNNNQVNNGTTLILTAVNSQSPEAYLANRCGMEPGATQQQSYDRSYGTVNPYAQSAPITNYYAQSAPITNYSTTLLPQPGANQITPRSPVQPVPATTQTGGNAEGTVHEVEKGETLYGISRRYGVTVGQIQEWNNLGSTTFIQVGDRLRVATPGSSVVTGRGPIATSNQGASQPVPYDAQSAPNPNERTHIVKLGETIQYLAQQYGFTEAKFREINDLGPYDFIKVGQRLRTNDCRCPEVGVQNQPAGSTVRPQEFYNRQPLQNQVAPGSVRPQQTTTTMRSSVVPSGSPTIVGRQSLQPQQSTSSYNSRSLNTTTNSRPLNSATNSRSLNTATNPRPSSDLQISNVPDFGGSSSYPNPSSYDANQGRIQTTQPLSPNNNPVLPYRGSNTGSVQPNRSYSNNSPYNPGSLPYSSSSSNSASEVTPRGTPINSYNARSYSELPGNKRRVHIVQEGENIVSIAQRYGMNPNELTQLNDILPGETIMVHQLLYLD